jgi:hypothetical protein
MVGSRRAKRARILSSGMFTSAAEGIPTKPLEDTRAGASIGCPRAGIGTLAPVPHGSPIPPPLAFLPLARSVEESAAETLNSPFPKPDTSTRLTLRRSGPSPDVLDGGNRRVRAALFRKLPLDIRSKASFPIRLDLPAGGAQLRVAA